MNFILMMIIQNIDSEYDKLKTEILILEKKYSFISKLALSKKKIVVQTI